MNVLEVKDLRTYFYVSSGIVKAVDGISFEIEKGKVFGLVGESGSGKTISALSILKLVSLPGKIIDGDILFNGLNLLKIDEEPLRRIRGSKISFVFQEPASSFNPVFTIGEQIVETIITHQSIDRNKARELTLEYLHKAHIEEAKRVFYSYPHQLSGGTKQRSAIAMALVNSPELIILDEPTTALDVTIQARILDMLKEIISEERLSVLFISHDLGIIARMCDNVAVMRKGIIVEKAATGKILNNPEQEYTRSLLESVKALS